MQDGPLDAVENRQFQSLRFLSLSLFGNCLYKWDVATIRDTGSARTSAKCAVTSPNLCVPISRCDCTAKGQQQ